MHKLIVLALVLLTFSRSALSARAADHAAFSPHSVAFGQVPWGTSCSQLVTVVLTGGRYTDVSRLYLMAVEDQIPNPNLDSVLFSHKRVGTTLTLTYKITLPQDVGKYRERLTLMVSSPTGLGAYPYYPDGATVTGEVVPCFTASSSVEFGDIVFGQGKAEYVDIACPNDLLPASSKPDPAQSRAQLPPLRDIVCTSQSAYVTFGRAIEMGSMYGSSRHWELQLSPQTPQGQLNTTVTFTSPTGQVIVVPVTANITTASHRQSANVDVRAPEFPR